MIVDYNPEFENLISLGSVGKTAGKIAASKIMKLQDLYEVDLEDLEMEPELENLITFKQAAGLAGNFIKLQDLEMEPELEDLFGKAAGAAVGGAFRLQDLAAEWRRM